MLETDLPDNILNPLFQRFIERFNLQKNVHVRVFIRITSCTGSKHAEIQ